MPSPPLTLMLKRPGDIVVPGEVRLGYGKDERAATSFADVTGREHLDEYPVGAVVSATKYLKLGNAHPTGSGVTNVNGDYTVNASGQYQMIEANQSNGAKVMAKDLAAMRMDHVLLYGFYPIPAESTQHTPAQIDALGNKKIKVWLAPWGNYQSSPTQSIAATFFGGTDFSLAAARPHAAAVLAWVKAYPRVRGYVIRDDVSTVGGAQASIDEATGVANMVAAFHEIDPRPASGMHRDGYLSDGSGSSVALLPDPGVIWCYEYQWGRYPDTTETQEGDAHRSQNYWLASDWIDHMCLWFDKMRAVQPNEQIYLVLQAHATGGTGSSPLKAPTPKELQKQFWQAIAIKADGLFWFCGTDGASAGGTTGEIWYGWLGHQRQADRSMIARLNMRLTPTIRRILTRCDRVADAFTVSGGGQTRTAPGVSYAHGWVRTLKDRDTGVYYAVMGSEDVSNVANLTPAVTGALTGTAGVLRSLETGAEYQLGQGIPFDPLDGSIFQYDPVDGVPKAPINFGQPVETFWLNHWANPAGPRYRPASATRLYSNVVQVPSGVSLQTYFDLESRDDVTFRLAADATYAKATMPDGVKRWAVVSDVPAAPAKPAGIYYFGTVHARQYNSAGTVAATAGFPKKLFSGTDASFTSGFPSVRDEALGAFLNPPGGLIFKDLHFVSDGSLVYYQKRDVGDGVWQTDHYYVNAALAFRCVKDVLVEGCTFDGYKWGTDDSTAAPNTPHEDINGATGHPGVIWGNAGIENVVVRSCTFNLATNAGNFGFPWAVFFDGPRGLIVQNVTVVGKCQSGAFMCLTNDDYTFPAHNQGYSQKELRQGQYMVVQGCDVSGVTSGGGLITFTGRQCLSKGNIFPGGRAVLHTVETKVNRESDKGVYYEAYGCVFDGNTVPSGNITVFVGLMPDPGWNPGLTATSPVRSRVGYVTVKNNSVAGTITNWVKDIISTGNLGAPTAPSDGTPVITGNNKNDGSGVGL